MHVPVLLKEVADGLNLKSGDNAVDGTVGGGGHAAAILEKTAPGGKLLGIDADEGILGETEKNLSKFGGRAILQKGNFSDLEKIIDKVHFTKISAILFDLGMSSYELEKSGRGFSFLRDESLDMRFDASGALTAELIVNYWPEEKLAEIFGKFGQERFARLIAARIVRERKTRRIKTTAELVETVRRSFPRSYKFGRTHFATRVFQALRIAVNNELSNLEKVLPQAFGALEKGGRLAVISFHSLEDGIVKKFFRLKQKEGKGMLVFKKPITASREEIKNNPRARSAKLRIIQKL